MKKLTIFGFALALAATSPVFAKPVKVIVKSTCTPTVCTITYQDGTVIKVPNKSGKRK